MDARIDDSIEVLVMLPGTLRLPSVIPMLAVLCVTEAAHSGPTAGSVSAPQTSVSSAPGTKIAMVGSVRQDEPMPDFQLVVERARLEVTRRVIYDSRYVSLSYPGGDVDPSRGVCTDVVVRALRAVGIDLQRLVHEDILRRPGAYKRGGKRADASIDHRRATALLVWFEAYARVLPRKVDTEEARMSYAPGDILVWSLHNNGQAEHVGVVSDRKGPRGLPLVIHNIGPVPTEEDVLDGWQILGHFRPSPAVRGVKDSAVPPPATSRR